MASILQEKLFNKWWKDSLFHTIVCHRLKDIDWRIILKNAMINRGKMDKDTFFECDFAETIFKEFDTETKMKLEERTGIYQFDAGFSKLDSEIYAYIDVIFTPQEKEELKQIKLEMRQSYGI